MCLNCFDDFHDNYHKNKKNYLFVYVVTKKYILII